MKEISIEKDLNRPWGGFVKFIENKPCTVKILEIKSKEELSLQSHQSREEFWYVIKGEIEAVVGESKSDLRRSVLKEGGHVFVPRQALHRIKGMASPKSLVLEISTGEFSENDEIRYEDKYGRKSPQ